MGKVHYAVWRTAENDNSIIEGPDNVQALEWLREGHGHSLRLYIGDKEETGTSVLNLSVSSVYAVMMDVVDLLKEKNMPLVYKQNDKVIIIYIQYYNILIGCDTCMYTLLH